MPPQFKVDERYDLRGGMSRTRRQTLQQAYLTKNLRPKSDGTLEARKGRLIHSTLGTSGVCLALYGYHTAALGSRLYSVQRSGGKDYVYDNTTEITGPSLTSGLFANIAEYKDTIFIANGQKPIQYHVPGTTVRGDITGSPDPPIGSYIVFYKDRCFVGKEDGDVAFSNTGMFSALPACDFPANNKVTLGSVGDGIKGLVPGQDYLVAFRKRAYHVMTGSPNDDGGIGDMSWQSFEGIGCPAPNSIATRGKQIAFLGSDRRLYMLEGSTSPVDLDENDYIREYLTDMSPGSIPYVNSVFWGNELWVAIPQGSDITTMSILVRNMVTGSWTMFTNIDVSRMHYADTTNKLYGGEIDGDDLYELESSYLDGSDRIPTEFISRGEVLGSFHAIKTYKDIYVQADVWSGESLIISYAIDKLSDFTVASTDSGIAPTSRPWGATIWGGAVWGGLTVKNHNAHLVAGVDPKGSELRFRITGNVSGHTKILSYAVSGYVEEREGGRF